MLVASLPTHAENPQSNLPEPWSSLPNLTEKQARDIKQQLDATAAQRDATKVEVPKARRQIYEQMHITDATFIECDTNHWIANQIHLGRIDERRRIAPLLTKEQRQYIEGAEFDVELYNFSGFKQLQAKPMWCWAASVQMLLNYNCVVKSQEQVVELIKDSIIAESATAEEVMKVQGWRLSPKDPKSGWHAQCEYESDPMDDIQTIGMLDMGRMLLIALKSGHIVVGWKAHYSGFTDTRKLISLTVFDPADGKDKQMSSDELRKTNAGWWYAWVATTPGSKF